MPTMSKERQGNILFIGAFYSENQFEVYDRFTSVCCRGILRELLGFVHSGVMDPRSYSLEFKGTICS